MQYPFGVDNTFKAIQHVVVPYELPAGGREVPRIGPHLGLEGQRHVIGVTKIEVTREIHILKDL